MRIRSLAALTVAATLALPIHAQAPAQPTAPTPAPAVSLERSEEPSLEERRLVAYVSTGVAVASLATGITMGVLAKSQFDCAADIITCNGTLQNKVVGEEMFDMRAEIEQKALFADMAFLFAGASAIVATVGYLRGFVFVDEPTEASAEAAPTASLVVPTVAAPVVTASLSSAPVAAVVSP
jgi:hypothetical protein